MCNLKGLQIIIRFLLTVLRLLNVLNKLHNIGTQGRKALSWGKNAWRSKELYNHPLHNNILFKNIKRLENVCEMLYILISTFYLIYCIWSS